MSSVIATAPPSLPRLLATEVMALRDIGDRLAVRFPHIARAHITEAVAVVHQQFDDARIRDFVPVLVERRARDVLVHRHTPLPA